MQMTKTSTSESTLIFTDSQRFESGLTEPWTINCTISGAELVHQFIIKHQLRAIHKHECSNCLLFAYLWQCSWLAIAVPGISSWFQAVPVSCFTALCLTEILWARRSAEQLPRAQWWAWECRNVHNWRWVITIVWLLPVNGCINWRWIPKILCDIMNCQSYETQHWYWSSWLLGGSPRRNQCLMGSWMITCGLINRWLTMVDCE